MPSFAFVGRKVGVPCRTPNGNEWARPTRPHSVKHGGLTHSVKHGGKIGLVENKTSLTPWWKIKFLWGGSVKQNHSAQKITLSVKQR
jgi:hypothetical protein